MLAMRGLSARSRWRERLKAWGLMLGVAASAAAGAGQASASPVGPQTSLTPGPSGAAVALAHVAQPGEVRLVGNQVLFTDGASELDSVSPGGVPSRLFSGPGPTIPGGYEFTITGMSFAASPALLAVHQYIDHVYKASDTVSEWLETGPLGGPFSVLPNEGACTAPPSAFAVSGSTLAYLSCGPGSTGGSAPLQIVLHDASAAGAPDRTLAVPMGISQAGGDALAMAGTAVAGYFPVPPSGATGEIVVWDATTGSVRYTVPVSAGDGLGLAVQDDQTVAFLIASGTGCGVVAWASVAQPSEHDVPGCAQDGVRLVGDRLAYVAGGMGTAALVTTDLSGANSRPALELGAVPLRDFDFDGGQLASEIPACDGGADYALLDASTNQPATVDPSCPATIPAQLPVLERGTINVSVMCPLGCHGDLTARTAQGASLGSTQVRVAAGQGSGVFQIALTQGAAKHSRDRALSLHLTLTGSRLDGGTTSSTQTVTVRLPAVIEHASLTGLATRTPKLRFDLLAGRHGAAARALTVSAPKGLAFAEGRRTLIRGVRVTSETGRRLRFAAGLSHGRLTVRFPKPAPSARIVIISPGVTVTGSLARAVRRGRVRRVRILVSDVSSDWATTRIRLRLRVR